MISEMRVPCALRKGVTCTPKAQGLTPGSSCLLFHIGLEIFNTLFCTRSLWTCNLAMYPRQERTEQHIKLMWNFLICIIELFANFHYEDTGTCLLKSIFLYNISSIFAKYPYFFIVIHPFLQNISIDHLTNELR